MRLRLTLGGDGQLTDRHGNVLGQVETITVNLDSRAIRALSDGSEGVGVVNGLSLEKREEDSPTPSQESFLPDPVNETWAVYTTALDRPKAQLLPKVRKWIRDAHEAVGEERTRDAIRGLAASQYHRDNNYVGIEYAIVPKQRETIEGRVEKMCAYLPASQNVPNVLLTEMELLRQFPTEDRTRFHGAIIHPIHAMLEWPENEELKIAGRRALKHMEGLGYETVIEDNCVTGYRKAGG